MQQLNICSQFFCWVMQNSYETVQFITHIFLSGVSHAQDTRACYFFYNRKPILGSDIFLWYLPHWTLITHRCRWSSLLPLYLQTVDMTQVKGGEGIFLAALKISFEIHILKKNNLPRLCGGLKVNNHLIANFQNRYKPPPPPE